MQRSAYSLFIHQKEIYVILESNKGRVQKPQSRKMSVMGGGYPPFPLTFWAVAFRYGAGGTPIFR